MPSIPATPRRAARLATLPLLALLLLPLVACDIPRDPRGTLSEVRGGELVLGVVADPPWVTFGEGTGAVPSAADGEPGGIEVELMRAFADDLGAELRFVRGSLPELTEALALAEIHAVVGGVTVVTPGIGHAAHTNVYLKVETRLAAPGGGAARDGLDDRRVFVPYGNPVAQEMRQEGAETTAVEALPAPADLPPDAWVAAPAYELERLGYPLDGPKVYEEHHVMLTIPGENGFLVELERFLHRQRPELEARVAGSVR